MTILICEGRVHEYLDRENNRHLKKSTRVHPSGEPQPPRGRDGKRELTVVSSPSSHHHVLAHSTIITTSPATSTTTQTDPSHLARAPSPSTRVPRHRIRRFVLRSAGLVQGRRVHT